MFNLANQIELYEISDRRAENRILFDSSVLIASSLLNHQHASIEGKIQNLSKGGANLTLPADLPIDSEIVIHIHSDKTALPIYSTARVMWRRENKNSPCYGIKFKHTPELYQAQLRDFVSKRATLRVNVLDRRCKTKIISEPVEFKTRNNQKISAFIDHHPQTSKSNPFVLLPCYYGTTKINLIPVSYYLANNGLNVIRFDLTNHIGESDGEHLDFKMSSLKGDIFSTIDYVHQNFNQKKVGIGCASLASRAAIKALAEDPRIAVLTSIMGIINAEKSMMRVHGQDLMGEYKNGKKWGTQNFAGFDVNDDFLRDCLQGEYNDLDSTLNDLKKTDSQAFFVYGSNDPFIDPKDYQFLEKSLKSDQFKFFKVPALHKLEGHPLIAKTYFKLFVELLNKILRPDDFKNYKFQEPDKRAIGFQINIERSRNKNLEVFTKDQEKGFWNGYLKGFQFINHSEDYKALLHEVTKKMGKIRSGDKILDVGCGNGTLALHLIKETSELNFPFKTSHIPSLNYLAGDIDEETLEKTRKMVESEIQKIPHGREVLKADFQLLDLDFKLPFLSNSFDKICANLVLSYVTNPANSLAELVRVLRPNGMLIVTSIKNEADLCQIYRNHILRNQNELAVEEARMVLSNAGKILLKEAQGVFQFFSKSQLQKMASRISPKANIAVSSCFSDQGVLLAIRK